jgi:hypothetical protein
VSRSTDELNGCAKYAIGPDDRIQLRVDLICADDDAAKKRARQLADGLGVTVATSYRLFGSVSIEIS